MTTQPTSTTPLARLQELLPQLFQTKQLPGHPYLRFQLMDNIGALMSMEYVHESVIVPSEKITALPNMARSVLGLMSSRDQVCFLVSLPHLLGYPALSDPQQQYRVIVVRIPPSTHQPTVEGDALLGLAVPKIHGISRLNDDQLQGPSALCPVNLKPYVMGTWQQQDRHESYILNPLTLAQAPTLHPAVD